MQRRSIILIISEDFVLFFASKPSTKIWISESASGKSLRPIFVSFTIITVFDLIRLLKDIPEDTDPGAGKME